MYIIENENIYIVWFLFFLSIWSVAQEVLDSNPGQTSCFLLAICMLFLFTSLQMKKRLCALAAILVLFVLAEGYIEELRLPDTFSECILKQKTKNNGTDSYEARNKYCVNSHRMKMASSQFVDMNVSADAENWINELLRMSNVDMKFNVHYINKRQAIQPIPANQNSVQVNSQVYPQVQFPSQSGSSSQSTLNTQSQLNSNSQQNIVPTQQQLPPQQTQIQTNQIPSQAVQTNFNQIPGQQIPAVQTNQIPSQAVQTNFNQIPAQIPAQQPQIPVQPAVVPVQPQIVVPPQQPIPQSAQVPPPSPRGNPRPRMLRIRKEIRMMTDAERANFFRAIQMLKADTVSYRNKIHAIK